MSRSERLAYLLTASVTVSVSMRLRTQSQIVRSAKEDVQKSLDNQELYELRFLEALPIRALGLAQIKNLSLSFAAEAFKKAVLINTM